MFVLRSAKRFRVEPACSKADQNAADAMNNTRIAQKRLRSAGEYPFAVNNQTKKTTTIPVRITPKTSESASAEKGRNPLNASAAPTTITISEPVKTRHS